MGSLPTPPNAGQITPNLAEDLRSSLKDSKMLTPGSDAYEAQLRRWSDIAIKRAGAILLPVSNADISTTLLFAHSHDVDFAVCGGGHSSSGAASSDGGIVIDLSRMRSVTVDTASNTLTAQGGCVWADVDAAAAEHGLATVGGTVNHTGIGGLTLGGGYGWLSGKYGLTIDNLLSVEIVLADGRTVTSSPRENEDLFWAIRGAGQSFGVVTSFTYRCYEQANPVFAGTLAFPPPAIPAVLDFANKSIKAGKGNAACILVFAVAPPPISQPMLMCALFHNGPEDEGKAFFKPLLDLEPVMNTTAIIPYSSVNAMLNPVAAHGGRKSTKGATFAPPMRTEFALSLFQRYSEFVTEVPDASGSLLLFEFFSPDKICETSNRAMAFANRDFYGNIMAGPQWRNEANDERCRQWARDMVALFQEEMERAREEGKMARPEMEGVGAYANYDGEPSSGEMFSFLEKTARKGVIKKFIWVLGMLPDRTFDIYPTSAMYQLGTMLTLMKGRTVFGANYERLIELKRKWDPENVFSKSHLLGPQLDAWHGGVPSMTTKV
ncbi:MAG: hypothetical protein Q9218_002007 [Villophora microphyllina]